MPHTDRYGIRSYVLDPLALRDLSALHPSSPILASAKYSTGRIMISVPCTGTFGSRSRTSSIHSLAVNFWPPESGLEALLRSRFHVELNKKYQRADWSRRPLSPEMVEYAAMDGMYLIPLARMLEKDWKRKSRLSWVEEECLFLSKVRFTPPNHDPLYLKVKGAFLLDSRSLCGSGGLASNSERPLPKNRIFPPSRCSATNPPGIGYEETFATGELNGKVLSRKQIDRYGTRLLHEIHRPWPLPMRSSGVLPGSKAEFVIPLRNRIKALKTWRDMRAKI